MPDCRIDRIKHLMVCPTACRQCCGLVCVLTGHRSRCLREGATGAGHLCLKDQRQAKLFDIWSCSLLLVERLMWKLAAN